MENIFQEILAERQRQIEKFGIQDHPILDPTLMAAALTACAMNTTFQQRAAPSK